MNPFRPLLIPGIMLLVIITIGLVGYTRIEGWSLFDAAYMLVITLATVGYREVHTLSPAGRVLTMFLIVSGVGTAVYAVSQAGSMIIEGHIVGYTRRRRMNRKIKEMKDHYIVCGFGRVGHKVASEFNNAGVPYVVIDIKPETGQELETQGVPYLIGSISSNGILKEAGVDRAKGLVACADSDVENVYVTLSARALNPGIYIVARASVKESEERLKMAGANKVISPYFISGKRMAALVTKPITSDFLDTVMHGEHLEFSLNELTVSDNSFLINKTLAEAQIRQKSGATILAIRKLDGGFNLQPLAITKIEKGDVLIVIGTQEQLELLGKMIT